MKIQDGIDKAGLDVEVSHCSHIVVKDPRGFLKVVISAQNIKRIECCG